MLSLNFETPSVASNAALIPSHTVMFKQFGSQ